MQLSVESVLAISEEYLFSEDCDQFKECLDHRDHRDITDTENHGG